MSALPSTSATELHQQIQMLI